jgi:hypothetical protein
VRYVSKDGGRGEWSAHRCSIVDAGGRAALATDSPTCHLGARSRGKREGKKKSREKIARLLDGDGDTAQVATTATTTETYGEMRANYSFFGDEIDDSESVFLQSATTKDVIPLTTPEVRSGRCTAAERTV